VTDFTLPELGENVTSGDVLRVLVQPGDTVAKDQAVLELETDKATIEVPSSVAGRVQDVKVKAGETVKVGQVILTVHQDSAGAEPGGAGAAAASPPDAAKSHPPQVRRAEEQKSAPAPAAETTAPARVKEEAEAPRASAQDAARPRKVVDISRGARPAAAAPDLPAAPAAPSVRRLARELGVDIDQVSGSGPGGRISLDDVKVHAKQIVEGGAAGSAAAAASLPDFTRWGEVERQPLRAVRRKTAQHLSAVWAAVPHVTQHDLADITGLEALRKRYAAKVEEAGGSLTITAVAVKIVAAALSVFPQFNASVDMAAGEIVLKKFVNIGIAVDTDRGLLVPVIRNADTKNIVDLAIEIKQLSEKARDRRIALEEMQGGCFTVSNLGGLGGSFFTPIVNAPEVAILGISRARMEPLYEKESGGFTPRLMLPLSLSYDHRVVDGADGVRFLRWVVEAFEQPFLLALEG
jgi:pyruvate dehydrogenase E2 component (dihydrolipoamide acetyltransferase)